MRPTADEFWATVDKQPGPDGCWMWTGRRVPEGYGRLHFDGRDQGAHRYAWILEHGEIGPTAHVLHQCPNRACVRPAHLLALTPAEAGPYKATRGYMARGDRHASHLHPERHPRGERQGSAKLTGQQVEQIRLRYAGGEAPITRLAEAYGVSFGHIWRIVTGQARQHDPGPTRPP